MEYCRKWLLSQALLSMLTLLLVSCAPHAETSTNLGANARNGLSLPQIAEVPMLASANDRELYVPITNYSSQVIELQNFSLGQAEVALNQTQLTQHSGMDECQVILPGKSCLLKVKISKDSAHDAGSLALSIVGKDKNQQQYTAQSIIYYHVVKDSAGVVFPRQINYDPNQTQTNGYLLIPLIIDHALLNPQVHFEPDNQPSQLVCDGGVTSQDCSLIVDLSKVAATAKSLQVSISNPQALNSSFQATIEISLNQSGHLVVGGLPLIISPANGSSKKTVTLLNNGNLPLTFTAQTVPAPLAIESNTCNSTTLAVGASCTLQFKASSILSGSQEVSINYTTNNEAKSLSFSAVYSAESSLQPNVIAYGSANFTSILVGSTVSGIYTLYNASLVPVIYQGLSNVSRQNADFSEDLSYSDPTKCDPAQVLTSGQWCTIQIIYQPTSKVSGANLAIVPVFAYSNSGGELLTYSKQVALTPYSSGNASYIYFGTTSSIDGKLPFCALNTTGGLTGCGLTIKAFNVVDNRQARSFLQVSESTMFIGFAAGDANPVVYASFNSSGNITNATVAKPLYTGSQTTGSTLKLNTANDSQIYGMGIYESWLYLGNRSSRNSNDIQVARCNFSSINGDLTNCSGYTKSQLMSRGFSNYAEIFALVAYQEKIYISTSAASGGKHLVYACQMGATGDLSACGALDIRDQNGESATIQLRLRTINNNVAYLVSYTNDQLWICKLNDLQHCRKYTSAQNARISEAQSVILYGQNLYLIRQTAGNNVVKFNLDQEGFITNAEDSITYTASSDYMPVAGISIAF